MIASSMTYKLNPYVSDGFLVHFKEYMESEGAGRLQKFVGDILAFGAETCRLSGKQLPKLQKISEVFSMGAMGLTIPQASSLTIGAYQAGSKLAESGVTRPRALEFFQKAMDSVAWISYSSLLFTESPLAKIVGDVFGAFADGGDVAIAGDRITVLSGVAVEKASVQAKEAIVEEKTLFYIKLAKAVTAAAGGILALLGFILGTPLVPAIVLLGFSVVSSAFAIGRFFYEKNRKYSDEQLVEKIKVIELKDSELVKAMRVNWNQPSRVCELAV